jgi:hypothetical protein
MLPHLTLITSSLGSIKWLKTFAAVFICFSYNVCLSALDYEFPDPPPLPFIDSLLFLIVVNGSPAGPLEYARVVFFLISLGGRYLLSVDTSPSVFYCYVDDIMVVEASSFIKLL